MRTLNDIVPPSRRKEPGLPADISPSKRRSPFGMPAAIVLVIVVCVGALIYFSSAKVEVVPNTASIAVQSSFTADQGGALPFQVITAQKIASQSVKSSGTKTVSTSASGTITIYNTQTKAQKLITNTRFATTAGLVFRIHSAVTVPGGSASKPGSVTAKVYADQPGSTYNVGPSSFTVPGLAGTPQADQVYARSTSPMVGGASGEVPVVDNIVAQQAQQALISALGPELEASLASQVPAGYILVPGAATTTYEALQPEVATNGTATANVREQGTATAVVFQSAALAAAIASSSPSFGYQGAALTLASAESLSLSTIGLPSPDDTSFVFTLTGTAPIVYTVNPATIAAAVAGKSRTDAETALTNYPEVKRAVLTLRPFWRQTFPEDPASIQVSVSNP